MAAIARDRKTESRKPQATVASSRELRKSAGDFISRAGFAKERFLITRNGIGTCALVSLADLEVLEELDALELLEIPA